MYTYTEEDRKLWFYQPQLTRWRHRYRGPRESLKINTEIGQLLYDLSRVNKKIDDLTDSLNELVVFLREGWDLDDDVEYSWFTDDIVGEELLAIVGSNDLVTRIEALRERVRGLENG